MGRRVREVDDAELRRTLSEALTREEGMVRLKRRLHALEVRYIHGTSERFGRTVAEITGIETVPCVVCHRSVSSNTLGEKKRCATGAWCFEVPYVKSWLSSFLDLLVFCASRFPEFFCPKNAHSIPHPSQPLWIRGDASHLRIVPPLLTLNLYTTRADRSYVADAKPIISLLKTERNEWNARMARTQREADRLRAVLWSNGIKATAAVASKAAAMRVESKAARRKRDNARRRDRKKQHPNRVLAPLEKTDRPGDGVEHRPVWPPTSRNLVGGANGVPKLAAGLGRKVHPGDDDDWRPPKAGMVPKSVGAVGRGRRDPTSALPSMSEIDDVLNFAESI